MRYRMIEEVELLRGFIRSPGPDSQTDNARDLFGDTGVILALTFLAAKHSPCLRHPVAYLHPIQSSRPIL